MQARSFTTKSEKISRILYNRVGIHQVFSHKDLNNDQLKNITYKNYIALYDTGATNTSITKKVAEDSGLIAVSKTLVRHADGESICDRYLVNIRLPSNVVICQLLVTEAKLLGTKAEILIGMDIISMGDFAVTNKSGKTVFTFRIPSFECIDFVKNPYRGDQPIQSNKIGRNDPCPCGSGKKYKKCCGK